MKLLHWNIIVQIWKPKPNGNSVMILKMNVGNGIMDLIEYWLRLRIQILKPN